MKISHRFGARLRASSLLTHHRSLITLFLWLAIAFCTGGRISAFAQGSLTPSGTPAPTMKTLQQVEPRIDLQNAPASAVDTSSPDYHFIINLRGSYYLSANLSVTKTNGIQINIEGATLDLNGFEISRTSGSGGNGIEISGISHRASVRNGSIKGFASGVNTLTSESFTYAHACAFRDLAVSSCTSYGILAGEGAVLEACRVHNNSGTAGIATSASCSLSKCIAWANTTISGIQTGGGCSLANCSASANTGTYGISVSKSCSLIDCSSFNNTSNNGIYAESGSSLTNCSAYGNHTSAAASAGISTDTGCTITHCTASGNSSTASPTTITGMGFSIAANSTIQGCTAGLNKGDGIHISSETTARDNTCADNGLGGDGVGIHAIGNHNRIEGNNVTGNSRGIEVDATGSLIIRNSAAGNTVNWDVASGNFILVINAAAAGIVSGDSGGTALGSTDPSANFTY